MASKYDAYWLSIMEDIRRCVIESMNKNESVTIDIKGITAYGERNNWYGSVEVSNDGIKGGNMAHIISLGKIILKQNFLEDIDNKKIIKLVVTNSLELKVEVADEKSIGEREIKMPNSPGQLRMKDSSISAVNLKEGLITYLAQEFEYPHEREMFDELVDKLRVIFNYGKAILVGNFFLNGNQIDAALFKDDAIIVIELKDYSGKVEGREEGKWRVGDTEMENPYKQVRSYKYSLLNKLSEDAIKIFGKQKSGFIDLGHISAIVLFRNSVEYNEVANMPPKIRKWFHVTDLQHVGEELHHITSQKLRITHPERMKILRILGIDNSMLYKNKLVKKIEDKARSINKESTASIHRYQKEINHGGAEMILSRSYERINELVDVYEKIKKHADAGEPIGVIKFGRYYNRVPSRIRTLFDILRDAGVIYKTPKGAIPTEKGDEIIVEVRERMQKLNTNQPPYMNHYPKSDENKKNIRHEPE